MPQEEIITELSMKLVRVAGSPSQVIFAVTMQDVIAGIAKMLGEKARDLNAADLLDIQHEVRIAIDYGLDVRDYIQPGIQVWQAKTQ